MAKVPPRRRGRWFEWLTVLTENLNASARFVLASAGLVSAVTVLAVVLGRVVG